MRNILYGLMAFVAALSGVAKADDVPFREQRREVFAVSPVRPGDIVFLGNSITNFGVWPEMFSCGQRIVNRGVSGITTGEWEEHIEPIVAGRPAKLFVMLGINDFEHADSVVPSLRRIVERFRADSPETELFIQSVLPCNIPARKEIVAPLNSELRKLCEETGVSYIDIYSLLVDDGEPAGLSSAHTNDNLHLLASGYREWSRRLEPFVGQTVWTSDSNLQLRGLNTVNNIRLSQYAALPVGEGDVVMLGDYNVMMGEWHELLGNSSVKNRGFGIGWGYTLRIGDMARVAPVVVKGNPSAVFIECGARDLDVADAVDVDSLWAIYKEAVEGSLARNPTTMVYLQSVIPSVDSSVNRRAIQPFNRLMEAFAAATERVDYVDLYIALANDNDALADEYRGANTAQSHGINGAAYLKWAELIASLVNGD